MSYATGTAADRAALIAAIADFAAADGWTVVLEDATRLYVEKGICHAAFQVATVNVTDYNADPTNVVDYLIQGTLATALNAGNANFWQNTGSPTNGGDNQQVRINDLQGPFPAYWLFSDADETCINVVVQCGTDKYQHFGFGVVDKGEMTHGGAAYLVGTNRYHFRAAVNLNNANFNDIAEQTYPYVGNVSQVPPGNQVGSQLYCPDALPVAASWAAMRAGAQLFHTRNRQQPSQFPELGNSSGYLLSGSILASASQWGGNVMLWPIPAIPYNTTLLQNCYVGDYPNVRALNMTGLQPEQEIDLAGDTWVVFPIGRQTAWGTPATLGNQFSTGQYALAYKKVA